MLSIDPAFEPARKILGTAVGRDWGERITAAQQLPRLDAIRPAVRGD